jgi:hypothetical protein
MKIQVWIKETDLDRVNSIENGTSTDYSNIDIWTSKWEVSYNLVCVFISYESYMKILKN